MQTAITDPLVSDLARDLVQQVAPRELPLFTVTSRAYFQDPGKVAKRDAGDKTLGFGAEFAVFLTPVILTVAKAALELLSEILKDALKKEGTTSLADLLRRQFRREAPESAIAVTLSRDELAKVRERALETARRLVSEDQAVRIADALTASLATG